MHRNSGKQIQRTRCAIDRLIKRSLEKQRGNRKHQEALHRLITTVRDRTFLLSPFQNFRFTATSVAETALSGLSNVATFNTAWVRPCEDWTPPIGSSRRVFSSLLEHLFHGHAAPEFFVTSWLAEPSDSARQHQRWYVHICRTGSIRGCDVPFRFDRSQAKRLALAPAHLSVDSALNWARSSHESESDSSVRPRGISKHRWKTLQAAMQPWHRGEWKPINVRDLYLPPGSAISGDCCAWSIRQILRRTDLIAEGEELDHCVGYYDDECVKGLTAIFSTQIHDAERKERVLTIEVDPQQRRIITALGLSNSDPSAAARAIMEYWARQNRLSIGAGV